MKYTLARPAYSLHSTYTTVSRIGLNWDGTGGTSYVIQHSYGSAILPSGFTTIESNYPKESWTNTGLPAASTNWYRVMSYNGDNIPALKWVTNGPVITKASGFEVSRGEKNPANKNIGKNDLDVSILQIKVIAGIEEGIVITTMTLKAAGEPGDDQADIADIKLYKDVNKNGTNDGVDLLATTGNNKYTVDNGVKGLSLVTANTVSAGGSNYYLVCYSFSG